MGELASVKYVRMLILRGCKGGHSGRVGEGEGGVLAGEMVWAERVGTAAPTVTIELYTITTKMNISHELRNLLLGMNMGWRPSGFTAERAL